jgi:protein-S-isoprenylcysteine O-methyltransferase Ste14
VLLKRQCKTITNMLIFIIIWSSWLLSEILLSRFLKAKSPQSKEWDKNSLRIMWIAIIISISIGVFLMIFTSCHIPGSTVIAYVGLFVIISGMIVRILAIITLGNFFTVNLALHTDHQLVNKGLYQFIRHPSYSGSMLSFVGLGLSFNNWLSLVVIVIPVMASFLYRIHIEEKLMIQQFGEKYIDYQKNTKRMIPFVY